MKNFKAEIFPDDLKKLLDKSFEITAYFIEKLNEPNCPELGDLY